VVVHSLRRRTVRLLVLVAVVTALVLPAAPVPAQEMPETWALQTTPLTFKRGGVAYQLSVGAWESYQGQSVSVTISRTVDPKGVRLATQSHTYNFSHLDGVFDHADNLSTASISTGKKLGKWGTLKLNFRQNGAIKRACNGEFKSRPGTISGSLEFKTGTKRFATITNRPSKATLQTGNEGCTAPTSSPCPAPSRAVGGFKDHRRSGVSAHRVNGAKSATVSFFWMDMLSADGSRTLSHYSWARVPGKKVLVAKNLSTATVRGAKRTWISGEATFKSNGPASANQPYPCGKGKEVVSTYRPGNISGTLKVASFLGKNVGVRNMTGNGNKTAVRAR
jgi:hypothetical protein